MKKIFLVSNTDWYLYRFRLSLGKTLLENAMEPVFISPSGKYVENIKSAGFRWVEWGVDRKNFYPVEEFVSIIRFVNILRKENPDLIHNHTIKPTFYGSLSARLLKITHVINSITGRGYLFLGSNLGVKLTRRIIMPFYKRVTNQSSFVTIFENNDDLKFFQNQGAYTNTLNYIIPGVGVDTNYFSPTSEVEDVPVVAYVGRLLWDKGVQTFVDAARNLKQKSVPVRMVLIGSTDPGNPTSIPEKTIYNWVQDGIVEWWGWQENMALAYHQCHIVVMPSFGEGFSTTILEAMASGRAVIATDVPGCRDVVLNQRTGLLVPPQDPDALAETIRTMIADQELRYTFAKAGRELVEKNYTIGHINQLTLQIYQQVLSS